LHDGWILELPIGAVRWQRHWRICCVIFLRLYLIPDTDNPGNLFLTRKIDSRRQLKSQRYLRFTSPQISEHMPVRELELRVQNICEAYCEDLRGPTQDAFMWISSFVILVGTATFDWPEGTTMQSIMENSSQQQREALHCADEGEFLTMRQRAEWLMRAGEIRLMLHEGWAGNWDALNIMDACGAYTEALGETRAFTLTHRCIEVNEEPCVCINPNTWPEDSLASISTPRHTPNAH
jgi:hypothetical protein